jgi:hypothetical protein
MSDLSSPLLLLLASQGVIVLIRTTGQIVITCIALRGTAPEQRARILGALHGNGDARKDAAHDVCTRDNASAGPGLARPSDRSTATG